MKTYDDIKQVMLENDPAVTGLGPEEEATSLGFDPQGVYQHATEAAEKVEILALSGVDPKALLIALYVAAFNLGALTAKAQETVEA